VFFGIFLDFSVTAVTAFALSVAVGVALRFQAVFAVVAFTFVTYFACFNDSVAADRCRSVAEPAAVSFSSVDTFTFVTFFFDFTCCKLNYFAARSV
jgi:hypothetical protein